MPKAGGTSAQTVESSAAIEAGQPVAKSPKPAAIIHQTRKSTAAIGARDLATKKPKTSGNNGQAKDPSAGYKALQTRKLNGLHRLIWNNHNAMRSNAQVSIYESRRSSKGHDDVPNAEIDRCVGCISRQNLMWYTLATIKNARFKAGLKSGMREWNPHDVFQYQDTLDKAYLSVLHKSQAEKALASKAAEKSSSEIEEAAEKERDEVNEEIRRLEDEQRGE